MENWEGYHWFGLADLASNWGVRVFDVRFWIGRGLLAAQHTKDGRMVSSSEVKRFEAESADTLDSARRVFAKAVDDEALRATQGIFGF